MKLHHILIITLLPLTLTALTMWQSYRLGVESERRNSAQQQLNKYSQTLREAGAIISDASGVMRQLMTERLRQQLEGEARREQLRIDISADKCAHTLPDAHFVNRLREHAERATADTLNPAHPRRTDSPHKASPFPLPTNMGKHRDME